MLRGFENGGRGYESRNIGVFVSWKRYGNDFFFEVFR